MFFHYNPTNPSHYDYYLRCIHRLRFILSSPLPKLFIIFFPNHNNKNITDIQNYLSSTLLNTLSSSTSNFKLLCIFHFSNRSQRFTFSPSPSIDYLHLSTKSKSYGIAFKNPIDNSFFSSVFLPLYSFSLHTLPPSISNIININNINNNDNNNNNNNNDNNDNNDNMDNMDNKIYVIE